MKKDAMKGSRSPVKESLASMMAVITSVPCRTSGEYLEFQSKHPRETYQEIARAGLIKPGEWTGLNITRHPHTSTKAEWVQTEAGRWVEEYRDQADTIIPGHYDSGSGHYKTSDAAD